MQPEFSLQNNVNTISEDKSELLNNNAIVVDRAERSSTKNELLSFDLDTLNNDDDFQYLSIEARKNILFNK